MVAAPPAHSTPPTTRGQGATRATGAPLALTTSQKCPRGVLTVARGGSLVELRGKIGPRPKSGSWAEGPQSQPAAEEWTPPAPRRIKGFSRKSRGGLMRRIARIDRGALPHLPLFWTGTYPREWPASPAVWKSHLQSLCKRIQRRYPDAGIIWRLELQQRGAPHFHCLIFGVEFIPKRWLAQAWYEVVGSGDERHLRFGSRVERLTSWGRVVSYVSKYLAKSTPDVEGQDGPTVGRWWGVRGADKLPEHLDCAVVDDEGFQRVRRTLRNLAKSRGRNWTCYGRWSGGWTFSNDDTMGKLLCVAWGDDSGP